MRVLLDESLPRRLKQELPEHEITTVPEAGWAGTKNGDLLRLAEPSFEVFVTMDRQLPFQQNLAGLDLCVIILTARSNDIADLPELLEHLGQVVRRRRGGRMLVAQALTADGQRPLEQRLRFVEPALREALPGQGVEALCDLRVARPQVLLADLERSHQVGLRRLVFAQIFVRRAEGPADGGFDQRLPVQRIAGEPPAGVVEDLQHRDVATLVRVFPGHAHRARGGEHLMQEAAHGPGLGGLQRRRRRS